MLLVVCARAGWLLQGKDVRSLEADSQAASLSGGTGQQPGTVPSWAGGASNAGDGTHGVEFMPAQFVLGNPRWRSSVSGQIQSRVHPAPPAGNSRFSLEFGRWPKSGSGNRANRAEAAAGEPSGKGAAGQDGAADAQAEALQGDGNAVAQVSVRSKAGIGEWVSSGALPLQTGTRGAFGLK